LLQRRIDPFINVGDTRWQGPPDRSNRGYAVTEHRSDTRSRDIKRAEPSRQGARQTFWSIQYLRGLAATAVVVFHATTGSLAPAGVQGFELGAHGVDIFFVISGFIMFTAARNESVVRFWTVRVIRIYPLYWMALFATILFNQLTANYGLSGREVLASVLLWPMYSFGHPDKIWPILVPGWTLTYELLFYAIFSIGLLARRVVAVPVAMLLLLVVAGQLTHPHAAPLVVATSPLLTEFVIGLLLGVLVHRRALTLPLLLIVWGVAAAACWYAGFGRALIMTNAGGIVAAALLAEPLIVRSQSQFLKLLGDASYAIYLVHIIVIGMTDHFLLDVIARQGVAVRWGIVAVTIVLATLAGILVHILIERPMLKRLRPLGDILSARFAWGKGEHRRIAESPQNGEQAGELGPMTSATDGVVVYFAYGRNDIIEQTLYSLLTLLFVCERDGRACRIVIYTDTPQRFAGLPVETVVLSQATLDEWLAGSDYIHRRKTCVILDALDRFDAKIAFIDSDTWFAAHPARIFKRVGPGRAVFHICEGLVASTGTPFDSALARQLAQVPLTLRSNEPVAFDARTRMWNTGVIAVDPADRERMLDALALSDAIWRTADPTGAYNKKIHHAEQFATGYAFRDCELSEAADYVYHYWPAEAKRSFATILPRLVAQGLADPQGATLARCYAQRYRERGIRGWIDASKMAIRHAALTLGIPVKGARRSVI
jgi:exopolysaccharide production protein ExoZ